ncbi:MAG: hypothetical protein P4L87_25410 [Formivibrio sp.]|nr:hypothetical protein [Formivibrio sp.]
MANLDSSPAVVKRGPKPLGEHTMTAAERKRRSRARKAAEGSAEFMVRVQGEILAFVDRFAEVAGYTRSQMVQQFLDMAIAQIGIATAEVEQMQKNGVSEEQIAAHLRQAFKMVPQQHVIETYKEITNTK